MVDGAENDDHDRRLGRRHIEHQTGCAGRRAQPALGVDDARLRHGGPAAGMDDLALSRQFARRRAEYSVH